MSPSNEQPLANDARFGSTHWTAVLAAAKTHSPAAQEALEQLCHDYRHPLYAFARRKGLSHEDAEDVTQQFFATRVVTKAVLKGLHPERGKFRTWLLNSFQNFMHNEHAKATALKRGGEALIVSADAQDTQGDNLVQPQCDPASERYFDRDWAETLLQRAVDRLRESYTKKGTRELFEELAQFFPGGQVPPTYADLAAKHGTTEAAQKMRISRLRKELGDAVRAELKRTVADEREFEEELQYFRHVISS